MSQRSKKSDYESRALRELANMSEAQLQSKIVEPILRSLGFENVRDNSGPDETGKDLVATLHSEFGRIKLYAIQIKKVKLMASVTSKDSLGALFSQLLQARDEEIVDPVTNTKRSPDACVFVTPYAIAPSVWNKYHIRSKKLDYNNIELVDGSKLLDLIQKHIPHFLDNFSMEVRYRYQINRHLNKIPESILAFGLTSELTLDSIYVEAALKHSDEFFELIATRPLCKEGKKLITIDKKDIERLNEIEAWLGCKAKITDPPEVISSEEVEELNLKKKLIQHKFSMKVIQIDLDPIIHGLQLKLRDSLTTFPEISKCLTEEECTQKAASLIHEQKNLRKFRMLKPIWDNWLYFVNRNQEPEWIPPQSRIPAELLGKISRNKYILGEPGAGKTTLLRQLARTLLHSSNSVLPIFVPLTLLKEASKESLLSACIQQLENQGYEYERGRISRKKVLSQLSSGAFELFFDGIDEFGSDADELMSNIEQLAVEYPKCRITVSCRSTFVPPEFPSALYLAVVPFSHDQLSQFITKWFSSQPSSLNEINKWFESNPKMREAASNPLVAALLCSLFDVDAKMPSTEVELYGNRFDLLLGKWDQAKGIRRLPSELVKRYWKLIIELAFFMHMDEKRIVSMENAKDIAEQYFSADFHGSPGDMVLDCVHRGVLEYEANGALSFGHLTYQEYLAARNICIENDLIFILNKITEPWWFKTMSFYSAIKEDITSLIQLAIDNRCNKEVAFQLYKLASRAPWTKIEVISELKRTYDFSLFPISFQDEEA